MNTDFCDMKSAIYEMQHRKAKSVSQKIYFVKTVETPILVWAAMKFLIVG